MKWYAVKKEYIDYLKKWDKKIPNVDYGNRMKQEKYMVLLILII